MIKSWVIRGSCLLLLVNTMLMGGLLSSCAPASNTTILTSGGTVPMRVDKDSVGATVAAVNVTIDGQGPFSFTVDTGASQSVIDSSIAGKLDLPVVGRPEKITGVTGSTEAKLVKIDTWSVGSVTLPSSTIVSVSLPDVGRGDGADGLLGSDILSQFGSITIDYQGRQLTLPAASK